MIYKRFYMKKSPVAQSAHTAKKFKEFEELNAQNAQNAQHDVDLESHVNISQEMQETRETHETQEIDSDEDFLVENISEIIGERATRGYEETKSVEPVETMEKTPGFAHGGNESYVVEKINTVENAVENTEIENAQTEEVQLEKTVEKKNEKKVRKRTKKQTPKEDEFVIDLAGQEPNETKIIETFENVENVETVKDVDMQDVDTKVIYTAKIDIEQLQNMTLPVLRNILSKNGIHAPKSLRKDAVAQKVFELGLETIDI